MNLILKTEYKFKLKRNIMMEFHFLIMCSRRTKRGIVSMTPEDVEIVLTEFHLY